MHKSLNTKEEQEIIGAVEEGEQAGYCCTISGGTFHCFDDFLRKNERIEGSLFSTKKRDRPSEFPKLEDCLIKWTCTSTVRVEIRK